MSFVVSFIQCTAIIDFKFKLILINNFLIFWTIVFNIKFSVLWTSPMMQPYAVTWFVGNKEKLCDWSNAVRFRYYSQIATQLCNYT